MNMIRFFLLISFLMIFRSVFFGSDDKPSSMTNSDTAKVVQTEMQPPKNASPIDELIAAKPDSISPNGELAELFTFGSNGTDLQRQEELKKIKGKIVQWTLRVYEVSHVSGNKYRIQSESESSVSKVDGQYQVKNEAVSAMIRITAESEQEKSILLGLKTGSEVCIKGKLTGDTFLRSLEIKPAVLCGFPRE